MTVKELKELLKNIPDNAIVLSSEEGNPYELELKDVYYDNTKWCDTKRKWISIG